MAPELALDASLQRITPGPNSITYHLGYRSVFLRPNSVTLPVDLEQILPPRTIAINFGPPEGLKNVFVYAEEIVFLCGSKYSFQQKNLTIHCRSITFIHDTSASGPVEFDLSGANSTLSRKDGIHAGSGNAATYDLGFGFYKWEQESSHISNEKQAEAGFMGTDGMQGDDGQDGGDFTLTTDIECASQDLDKVCISVVTRGGSGSNGGDGGKGGTGGNGVLIQGPHSFVRDGVIECGAAFSKLAPLFPPGVGGNGGNAKAGGKGGSAGNINISFLLNGIKATAEEQNKLFKLNADVGKNGSNGTPGKAGDAGGPALPIQRLGCFRIQRDVFSMPSLIGGRPEFDPIQAIQDLGLSPQCVDVRGNEHDGWSLVILPERVPARGRSPIDGVSVPSISTKVSHAGKITLTPEESYSTLFKASEVSAHHLLMVIDRLKFEHFLYYTAQPFHSADDIKAVVHGSAFARSLEWLKVIIACLANPTTDTSPSAVLQKLHLQTVRAEYQDLAWKMEQQLDIFGNGMWKVSDVALGIERTKDLLKTYMDLEIRLGAVADAFQSLKEMDQKTRTQLGVAMKSAQSAISERGENVDNLKELHDKIIAADDTVKNQRIELKSALSGFRAEIAAEVHCDIGDILDAVSNVALFYNPEAGAVFAIGAIGTLAGSGHSSLTSAIDTLPTETGNKVEKSYLYSKIHTIEENVTLVKDALSEELISARHEKSKNPAYLSVVKVQAEKFNKMCDDYFVKIPGAKHVRADFDQLIASVQAKNDLLENYGEIVVKIAQLNLQEQQSTAVISGLQSVLGSGLLQSDDLQIAHSFMELARKTMKRLALSCVCQTIRAYNCMAFTYSEMLAPMANLHSFHHIDSTTLITAFDTWFVGSDINKRLLVSWETFKSTKTMPGQPQILKLTETRYPSVFRTLRNTGRLGITFDCNTAMQLDFSENWFDVRYSSIKVYFPGAVRIPAGNETLEYRPTINMIISSHGKSEFLDSNFAKHRFDLPASEYPFSYTYDGKASSKTKDRDGTERDVPGSVDILPQNSVVEADKFHFEMEKGHERDIYFQSPFTTWNVRLSEFHSLKEIEDNPKLVNRLDLSACKHVEFHFDLIYRGRERKEDQSRKAGITMQDKPGATGIEGNTVP